MSFFSDKNCSFKFKALGCGLELDTADPAIKACIPVLLGFIGYAICKKLAD